MMRRYATLLRFGIVGTVATAIHYGAYCLALLWTGPTVAYTIGYFVAFGCNYLLTTFFTFRSSPSAGNAIGFSVSHVINYLLEIGLLNLLVWLDVDKLVSGIAVLIMIVPVNFIFLRLAVYRGKH